MTKFRPIVMAMAGVMAIAFTRTMAEVMVWAMAQSTDIVMGTAKVVAVA
jgi:hypothetical protein